MPITKLIQELNQLHLPTGEYAITCSGPMAIKGIREARDLDIVVSTKLWIKLKKKYKKYLSTTQEKIVIGNIEIFGKHLKVGKLIYATAEQQIRETEIIEKYPFVKLPRIKHYKQTYAREKDLNDIELINEYLSKISSNLS
jgi:hypothetical protein